jgi:hypothetical protein
MNHPHYETAAAQQRREARERAEREAQAYLAHRAAQAKHQPRRVWHVLDDQVTPWQSQAGAAFERAYANRV